MFSARLRKLVAVSTFAVAIPLAIGTSAYAAEAPPAQPQQGAAVLSPGANGLITIGAKAEGPTERSAVDAATQKVGQGLRDYMASSGQLCTDVSIGVGVTQVGPDWWHAEATLTARCFDAVPRRN